MTKTFCMKYKKQFGFQKFSTVHTVVSFIENIEKLKINFSFIEDINSSFDE